MIRSIKVFPLLLAAMLLAGVSVAQQSGRDEGIELYRAGKFAEAVTRLTEAITADKKERQAGLYLAAAYKHLGKDKEALKAFQRTRGIKETNPPKYDSQVKITSKRPFPIMGENSSPQSNYSVAIELRSDGTVGIIIPYMIAFIERTNAIIETAKKIKFEPAIKDGNPVTVIHVLEYTFQRY